MEVCDLEERKLGEPARISDKKLEAGDVASTDKVITIWLLTAVSDADVSDNDASRSAVASSPIILNSKRSKVEIMHRFYLGV